MYAYLFHEVPNLPCTVFFNVQTESPLHPQPAAIATYKLVLIQPSERIWNVVTCFSSFYHDDLILRTMKRQSTVCRHWEMLGVNLTSNLLATTGCGRASIAVIGEDLAPW